LNEICRHTNNQKRYDIGGDMKIYEEAEEIRYWRRYADIRTSRRDTTLEEICRYTNKQKRYDIGGDMQTYEQAE
jgi:hypothetical protein